MLEKVPLM